MLDEYISREQMLNSLRKIEYSLNCRFEKDANLFISNQKSEEIKNMIYNSNWQGIHGMYITNNVSADILTMEIIKYSWLVNSIQKEDAKNINEIFCACNKNIFIEKANKVINNEIYTPYCIKQLIIPIYYMNIDINICKQILDYNKDNLLFNELIRKVCVKRVLDRCETPRDLYRTMKMYLNSNEIFKDSNVFKHYIDDLDKEETFIYELGKYIFEYEIEDNLNYKDTSWFKIFRNLGKATFDICSKYLCEEVYYDRDFSTSIVRYLMANQFKNDSDNVQYYEEEWIRLFNTLNSEKRFSFILGLRNIWNNETKEKIANTMLENTNITTKQREHIESILNPENDLQDPITNSVLEILINNKLNINDKKGHLNFLAGAFLRRYKNLEEVDSIVENINNINVETFIIQLINQSRKTDNKMLRYLLERVLINSINFNIEKSIISFIESKPSDFNNVRDIIQNYDFDFYKKVFGNI